MMLKLAKTIFMGALVGKNLYILTADDQNDYDRLKYYPRYIEKIGGMVVFLFLSDIKNIDQQHYHFKISSRKKIKLITKFQVKKLNKKLFICFLDIISLLCKIHVFTCYRVEPNRDSFLSDAVKFVKKSKGMTCLVPHGITSYGVDALNSGIMRADIAFYNAEFELKNSFFSELKADNVKLFRIGDLKLSSLCKSAELKKPFIKKHKACILASNLNQFKISDRSKLHCVLSIIEFAVRYFDQGDIVFRPHPRYVNFADEVSKIYPGIVIDRSDNNIQSIIDSEFVFSVTSTAVYESVMVNKNTIVFEPNELINLRSLLRDSPICSFFIDDLKFLRLEDLVFDGGAAMDFVKENLIQDDSVILSNFKKLFS